MACAPSEVAGMVVVPCLGALHPVVLAELSRQDIAVELAGAEHCAECAHASKGPDHDPFQSGGARNTVQRRQSRQLCGGHAACSGIRRTDKQEKLDATRRRLFRRIVGHGVDVVSGKYEVAPAPLKAIRAAAPFLPERKVLLNQCSCGQRARQRLPLPRHDAIPAEDWQVVRGCTYCEACVRVCPTGALQLLESNTAWRLALLNDRCVACDVCAEVCQPNVLRQMDAEEIIVNKQKGRLLAAVSKRRCTRCDRVFVNESGGEICPICSGDDDDFASIFG